MKFKKEFKLGAATAAHQVEGNNIHSDYWAQENIEHSVFKEPSLDAVDHYNRYEEDIKLLADSGLNSYRFSIEWARIQPEEEKWIESEIDHYIDVIKCCHKYGVEPIVTLHHFSSPKWLITKGGWENPDVVNYFVNYCSRLIKSIGNLVEYVVTINEANMRLQLAKLIEKMKVQSANDSDVQVGINLIQENMMKTMMETAEAFQVTDPRNVHPFISECTPEGDILVFRAHEAARDVIKELFPNIKVGLSLSLHDLQDLKGGESHVEKEWNDEFIHYLPYIKADDFLGVQCYSRKCYDENGVVEPQDRFESTQMGYENYPIAIANVIKLVARDYNGEMLITENGIATSDDKKRIAFIEEATRVIKECIDSGYNISGYMYWSLLDNFEWQKGYGMTFGLIGVDRTTQKREAKESLNYLGSLIEKDA